MVSLLLRSFNPRQYDLFAQERFRPTEEQMPEEYRYPNGRWKHDDWFVMRDTPRIETARRVFAPFKQISGASVKKWVLWDMNYAGGTVPGTPIEVRPFWDGEKTWMLPHALIDCAVEDSGWSEFAVWVDGEWIPCFKSCRAVHFGRRLAYYSGGLKIDVTVSVNKDGTIRSDICGWWEPPTFSWNKI